MGGVGGDGGSRWHHPTSGEFSRVTNKKRWGTQFRTDVWLVHLSVTRVQPFHYRHPCSIDPPKRPKAIRIQPAVVAEVDVNLNAPISERWHQRECYRPVPKKSRCGVVFRARESALRCAINVLQPRSLSACIGKGNLLPPRGGALMKLFTGVGATPSHQCPLMLNTPTPKTKQKGRKEDYSGLAAGW